MSFFLIPAILKSGIPASHATRILRTFFGVLAVADITHVGIATRVFERVFSDCGVIP